MRKIVAVATTILSLILVVMISGCANNAAFDAQDSRTETYWPTEGWRFAVPEEVGMDGDKLEALVQSVSRSHINNFIVVRDGYVAAEYYAANTEADELKELFSVTKSVTSALIGIAVEEGKIDTIEQPVSDYYPEWTSAGEDPRKQKILIKHLLDMTSGLEWPEWTAWNYRLDPLLESDDWNTFILNQKMTDEPGTHFTYNTGGSQLLSDILRQTTDMETIDYAKEKLFNPLGIRDVQWQNDPNGTNAGGFGLSLKPRDAAKFGYLYLREGQWDGVQLVPKDWVKLSTSPHSSGSPIFGEYGYHWWVTELKGYPVYYAMGYAGQYVFVVPKLDLVAVFTGWMPQNPTYPLGYMQQVIKAAE